MPIISGLFAKNFLNKLLDNADYSIKSCHHIIYELIEYDSEHRNDCAVSIGELNNLTPYHGLAWLLTNVNCDIGIFCSHYGFKNSQLSKHSQKYLNELNHKMFNAQGKQVSRGGRII